MAMLLMARAKNVQIRLGMWFAPEEVIKTFGAESCVSGYSSEDYRDDVKVSDEILKQVADSYSKDSQYHPLYAG